MRTEIRKLEKSEIEIEFEIPAQEFEDFIEKATFDLGKNLKIKGFRKGKLPKAIIEKEIGREKILKEAAERAIRENYLKVILENNLEVLGQPEIKILKLAPGNPLLFLAKVAILPEIQLPDYQKIAREVKKREILVKEKEIEEALIWLQKSRAKFSQILRPAQIGDFVEIEYSSPQIENGKIQKDGFLLGQGHLIEGFEEKLEGMVAGEEKNFLLKFPAKHFQKNLANQEINFKVKMTSVKKVEFPEIDDQFARSLGNFEDLNSLKERIREGIKMEKEILERERIHQEILEKIASQISWQIPQILIEAEKNRMIENFKKAINQKFQIDFKDYLARINKTEADLRESFQIEAERKIKNFLILQEIAKKEKISVLPEEVEVKINNFLKNYPDIEKAKKELDLENLKSYYEEVIRNEKALQLLESMSNQQ